jgi:cyclophilin family peptidyl-prolyl cis-trans isomerase
MATHHNRRGSQLRPRSTPPRVGRRDRFVRPCLEGLEVREVLSNFSTIGVFNPGSATWYLRNENSAGAPDVATPFQYGAPGWIPVVGDWNGDGSTTIGVVDPSTMTWYLRNENSAGQADVATPFQYGAPGWIPVVGDWGGTGHAGIGLFDPSTGTWYLRNEANAGTPDAGKFQYGGPGWFPVVGDWTGQGKTTVGVVDPSSSTWYLRNSNTAGAPDFAPFQYGAPGWTPVAGDWDSNGTYTVGVVDPASSTWYLRNSNSSGTPDAGKFQYGAAGWTPLAGLWTGTKEPFLRTPIPDTTLAPQGSTVLDLAAYFDAITITNSIVEFNTSSGPIQVQLFDRQAPQTVANFFDYVTSGLYNSSIFHRSVPSFVLQGGGFTFNTNPSRLTPIPTFPAVQNEPDPVNRSNVTGTIAMAKLGNDPNSATDQFFFNLADNSSILNNQNGGFTVFGRVLSQADMAVVNALASIPTQDQSMASALPPSEQGPPGQGVFSQIPLQNYAGTNFPTDTNASNYALLNGSPGVGVVRRTDFLTYSVVSNTAPSVVSTSLSNERLTLTAGSTAGTAVIVIRATNQSGLFVDTRFQVTVT